MKWNRISASKIAWLERCERHIWLDAHAEAARRGPTSATGQALAHAGIVHEGAVSIVANSGQEVRRIAADLPPLVRLRTTVELMRAGVPVIEQGRLLARIDARYLLIAQPDRLERRDAPSRLGAWSYAPIEIKTKKESVGDARLQLDVALWLVHELFGSSIEGELWLGADATGRPQQVERRAFDLTRVPAQIERLRALHDSDVAPPIWFVDACGICPWADDCTHEARERDDLVRMPGLKKATWLALNERGITTVDAFADLTPADVASLPEAGRVSAPTLLSAANALATNAPIWHGCDPLPDLGLVIDLETHRLNQEVWGWGWATDEEHVTIALYIHGQTPASLAVTGTTVLLVPDRQAGWAELEAAARRTVGRVAHWGAFDAGVIARHAPAPLQAALESRLIDAHHVMKERVTPPLERRAGETLGLKGVGTWLGIPWPEGVNSGVAAGQVFERWCETNDSVTLEQLVAYQRADLVAPLRVWRWLADHCTAPF